MFRWSLSWLRSSQNKDHRPDQKQIVVGAILDGEGRPICSEIWPGKTTDVKTLLPVVDRLRSRFGMGSVTVVADRVMISAETREELELDEKTFLIRSELKGAAGKALQAVGVAVPPTVVASGRDDGA